MRRVATPPDDESTLVVLSNVLRDGLARFGGYSVGSTVVQESKAMTLFDRCRFITGVVATKAMMLMTADVKVPASAVSATTVNFLPESRCGGGSDEVIERSPDVDSLRLWLPLKLLCVALLPPFEPEKLTDFPE